VNILVVEDELALREGLRDLLVGDGHAVELADDGRTALEKGLANPFDLVVLDLMLPGLDGVEVCRRLRSARPGIAILMLTARAAEEDKVRGLGDGADDYMTKPFSARELLARVRALGRRHLGTRDAETLRAGELTVELGRLAAQREGRSISLTAREAGILRQLHRCRGRAVSRAELLETVWGSRGDLETRAVDMAIAALRKKIEGDPAQPQIVLTVKGAGYMWGGD
jgi:two-component system response regulator RegX3